jgi:CHASE1-domain containing sensor protein
MEQIRDSDRSYFEKKVEEQRLYYEKQTEFNQKWMEKRLDKFESKLDEISNAQRSSEAKFAEGKVEEVEKKLSFRQAAELTIIGGLAIEALKFLIFRKW